MTQGIQQHKTTHAYICFRSLLLAFGWLMAKTDIFTQYAKFCKSKSVKSVTAASTLLPPYPTDAPLSPKNNNQTTQELDQLSSILTQFENMAVGGRDGDQLLMLVQQFRQLLNKVYISDLCTIVLP